ncbi:restriction endonuclease [uncultured Psychroserpens sp.]|uniref:restriction endonuclease n=1 Tax=uncultured Psychroserpens sp. TaxID=255436 RepID=UPI0026169887|nr:restriction endonuclease [uncultured Psychroserpens sp.]
MKSFAEIDIENNGEYLKLLSAVSKLSGLFSDNSIPLINYRVAENIFCRSFVANNLSRSDVAFDADYNSVGIGLKTFISKTNTKTEKIAEFNKLSERLKNYKGKELAIKLGKYRNDRINLAKRLYDIKSSIYHIVARREKELILFETDYNHIDIRNIESVKENKSSLQFYDGKNFYTYNYSKSTLYRKFIIPEHAYKLKIDIIEDPYSLLLDLFPEEITDSLIKGKDYIILPLYGIKNGVKYIYEKSGLNQWHAKGRKRNKNEIYIPVPAKIHHKFPNFFPSIKSDKNHFNLHLPNRKTFKASMCQTSKIEIGGKKINKGKGLMTKSNKGLGEWLLRKALQLKEGEIATIEMLNDLGYDSVIIIKEDENNYKIDIMKTDSYAEFWNNELPVDRKYL